MTLSLTSACERCRSRGLPYLVHHLMSGPRMYLGMVVGGALYRVVTTYRWMMDWSNESVFRPWKEIGMALKTPSLSRGL